MTYEQARPWAKAIKDEVLNRRMPPWGAVKGYGEFKHDPSLTQEQIGLIAQWVEGGAPEGDPKLLPPRPGADKTKPIVGRRQPLPQSVQTPFALAGAGTPSQRVRPAGLRGVSRTDASSPSSGCTAIRPPGNHVRPRRHRWRSREGRNWSSILHPFLYRQSPQFSRTGRLKAAVLTTPSRLNCTQTR